MLLMAPSVCSELAPVWQILGWVLWVFKIAIPIIIIIFGMIDLGKAVVASKDDEIKKAVKSLVMRAISGIVIFFIPTLVGAIFSLVGEFKSNEYSLEYKKCKACITSPGGNTCEKAVCTANDKKWNDSTGVCN